MKLIIKKHLKKSFIFNLYKIYENSISRRNPEDFIRKKFRKFYGQNLNLAKPKLLSGKIQYLKLYDYCSNFKVIQAADKYTLHEYLVKKI